MFKVTFVVWIAVLLLSVAALSATARQLVAIGSPPQVVVEYNAFENAIKIGSKVDFAHFKVTFDDTPGQYVTVTELRGWVKARPKIPPMPPR